MWKQLFRLYNVFCPPPASTGSFVLKSVVTLNYSLSTNYTCDSCKYSFQITITNIIYTELSCTTIKRTNNMQDMQSSALFAYNRKKLRQNKSYEYKMYCIIFLFNVSNSE